MDTRNVQLTLEKAQEWYQKGGELKEVALQAFTEEELKDSKPRSWRVYCRTRLDSKETRFGYTIGSDCEIVKADWDNCVSSSAWRDVLPSEELVKKFLAYEQLMSLRQDWIGDWEADWESNTLKYVIIVGYSDIKITSFYHFSHPLSFPTEEMAEDFLNCFKDLLKEAKGLY